MGDGLSASDGSLELLGVNGARRRTFRTVEPSVKGPRSVCSTGARSASGACWRTAPSHTCARWARADVVDAEQQIKATRVVATLATRSAAALPSPRWNFATPYPSQHLRLEVLCSQPVREIGPPPAAALGPGIGGGCSSSDDRRRGSVGARARRHPAFDLGPQPGHSALGQPNRHGELLQRDELVDR